MFIRVYGQSDERVIAASFSEGRVVLVSADKETLLRDFALPGTCDDNFDLSADCKYLATAHVHGRTPWIGFWDVERGTKLAEIRSAVVINLALDKNSSYVVAHTLDGTFIHALTGGSKTRVPYCGQPRAGDFRRGRNELYLPTNRKGQLRRISFDPPKADDIILPIKRTLWTLRWAPTADVFCVVDSTGSSVRCFDADTLEVVWQQDLPGREFSEFTYTADGTLLGIRAGSGRVETTLVLDASTGELLRTFEARRCGCYPYADTRVLSSEGEILDLATGEVDDRLTKVTWWRGLGL